MRTVWAAGMATLAMLAGAAGADVKAGYEAWQRGDWTRAVEEWRAPAVAGDADAEFNLGQAYKLGRGVPIDPALALDWFRKAALQGHNLAEDNYGLALFQSGEREMAAPWLEKSVARGERRAQLVLGTMLFNGDGVPRDYPRAYALTTRASQQGLRSAGDALAQMDQYVSPEDRQRGTELARQYAERDRLAALAAPAPRTINASGSAPVPAPAPAPRTAAAARLQPRIAATPPRVGHVAQPAGRWRVQFGAFRDAGNAHALWSDLAGRLPGSTPVYVKAAGFTRLQATGFSGRAAAQQACVAARTTCVVLAP